MITGVAMDHGGKCYHEACFTCNTCRQSLEGNTIYFWSMVFVYLFHSLEVCLIIPWRSFDSLKTIESFIFFVFFRKEILFGSQRILLREMFQSAKQLEMWYLSFRNWRHRREIHHIFREVYSSRMFHLLFVSQAALHRREVPWRQNNSERWIDLYAVFFRSTSAH